MNIINFIKSLLSSKKDYDAQALADELQKKNKSNRPDEDVVEYFSNPNYQGCGARGAMLYRPDAYSDQPVQSVK